MHAIGHSLGLDHVYVEYEGKLDVPTAEQSAKNENLRQLDYPCVKTRDSSDESVAPKMLGYQTTTDLLQSAGIPIEI